MHPNNLLELLPALYDIIVKFSDIRHSCPTWTGKLGKRVEIEIVDDIV